MPILLKINYYYTVFLSNLSHQRHRTVPNRTVPHYTVCDRILKNTLVTFVVTFKHRYKDRHIKRYFLKKNSVTENSNRYTYRYRYYP